MEKITIQNGKVLKLANVLIKKLYSVTLLELDEAINQMMQFIDVTGIQTCGPLITHVKGTYVTASGEVSVDYDIMIQTIGLTHIAGYDVKETYKTGKCLYTHFDGVVDDFHFAQNKLALYAWENEILTTGEEYIVYMENDGFHLIADIFRPLK
ncbi:hypothetical protein [Pseudolactococcus paracarnosus]|uniref:Bacterial transcription activator effector binding domain-containing protein n=1 Tax=Pseudolactococcus paracarnosus TaxID=2749962 RepID=A0ABT0AKJ1_9LACT|nr:hypothetical protein [Lactococcus paracarnosus]MCJ1977080.1 hypothetical protein [Lactococcus paracarnosus]MCJ1983116.1 hypothetical protein [Lactococcus paracarnosus]MCJ1997213.1 hypothetical protein [Lactococcus paracarnosus]